MKSVLIVLAIGLMALSARAQTLQTRLEHFDNLFEFTSIQDALLAPDSVYRLNLKGQKLKRIPKEVYSAFPFLVDLDLSRNRIVEIPDSLHNLTQLRRLNLSKNKIEALPPSIGMLEKLEELVISQNELTALPDSIGLLKKLRMIDAWSNNLDELPPSMREMPALEVMDLRVIMMNYKKQEVINDLLPNVKVYMSEGCNCN